MAQQPRKLTYEAASMLLKYDFDTFKEQVDKGLIDIFIKDKNNRTLLWDCASSRGIDYLLKNGVDISAKDIDGDTVIHTDCFAALIRYDKLVHLLFNPNTKDKEGRTLLETYDDSGAAYLLNMDTKHFTEELQISNVFKSKRIYEKTINVLRKMSIDLSPLLLNDHILGNTILLRIVLGTELSVDIKNEALKACPIKLAESRKLLTDSINKSLTLDDHVLISGIWVAIDEINALDEVKEMRIKQDKVAKVRNFCSSQILLTC